MRVPASQKIGAGYPLKRPPTPDVASERKALDGQNSSRYFEVSDERRSKRRPRSPRRSLSRPPSGKLKLNRPETPQLESPRPHVSELIIIQNESTRGIMGLRALYRLNRARRAPRAALGVVSVLFEARRRREKTVRDLVTGVERMNEGRGTLGFTIVRERWWHRLLGGRSARGDAKRDRLIGEVSYELYLTERGELVAGAPRGNVIGGGGLPRPGGFEIGNGRAGENLEVGEAYIEKAPNTGKTPESSDSTTRGDA